MQKWKACRNVIYFILGFLFSVSMVYAATDDADILGKEKSKTYTLLQMSGTDGFILRGASVDKVFFLPILHEWDLNRVSLHFTLYRASLSNRATVLTLFVNDNPVGSLELTGRANDKTPWDVALPLSLLKGNTVNIKINSVASDYGFDCYNLTNPNYWVYVTGDSTVTYYYKPVPYIPDLSKFPYPFIKDPSLEKDDVMIVLPTQVNADNLAAAFYVTNALGSRQTWRGIKLRSMTADHLTEAEKKEANIIYVGTAKQLQLHEMNVQWPLMTNANGDIIDKDKKIINNQTGVIFLVTSPWNPARAILVVTGNSDTAVNNAALMLRDPNFSTSILFPGYALVPKTPEVKITRLDWTNTTLKELGYSNQAIYGGGENTLNYSIYLPDNKTIERLVLNMDYATSPFLSTSNNSTLTLKVNDLPVSGKTVDVNSKGISHWKYVINGHYFNPGINTIALSFSLKLKNNKCTPADASLSWAMVYNTTSLAAIFNEQLPLLDLRKFPSLLNNELIVAVPKAENYFTSQNFFQDILNLGIKLNKIIKVRFMTPELITIDDAKKSNILFLGNPEQDNIFNQYKTALPFYFANQKINISPNIAPYLAVSDETPISVVQLITSPFSADKYILMVSSLSEDGFRLGMELLAYPKKTELVNGNIALIYPNGTFTSIQSERLVEYAKNKKNIRNISHGVYIALLSLVLIAVIIVLARYVRKKIKYYFSKK